MKFLQKVRFWMVLACFGLIQEEYASIVGRDGKYLGILDVALLAFHRQQSLSLLIFDDEPEPKHCNIADILKSWVPEEALEANKWEAQCSAGNWDLVLCRFDMKRGSLMTLNHYLPAWSVDCLGEERYRMAWQILSGDVASQQLHIHKQLKEPG